MGSLDVCCDPGRSIRKAMRRLVGANATDVQVLHIARAEGRALPGKTPEESLERYKQAGEQLAASRFCLVPAGDNEVSSRLYSAMSAGCIPVVVANQLSGAFASHVPYGRMWIRVEQDAFQRDPMQLIARLRAIPYAEVVERRAKVLKYVADVTYDQGDGGGPVQRVASRLASNLLRAADSGCLRGTATPITGIYPRSHKYAADDKWGLNCSCTETPPRFFWGANHASGASTRSSLWTRGKVPTEVCRCLHCATLCPSRARKASADQPSSAKSSKVSST